MNAWTHKNDPTEEELCSIDPKLILSVKISSKQKGTYRLRAGVGTTYNLLNVVAKAKNKNEAKDILLSKVTGITSLWSVYMHMSVKDLDLPIEEKI